MLAPVSNFRWMKRHRRALISNIFAQAEVLMRGKDEAEAGAELRGAGQNPSGTGAGHQGACAAGSLDDPLVGEGR